jgi:lysophospholipase
MLRVDAKSVTAGYRAACQRRQEPAMTFFAATPNRIRLAVSLSVSLLLGLAVVSPAGAVEASTEAQLADPAHAQAIEQLWTTQGRMGHFEGRQGVKIAYAAFVQADRAAEQGAIVIVSGRTESMLKYKELVHDLVRAGYSVYLHDHRGQGLSDREAAVKDTPQRGHVGRFDDYVQDLRQFVAGQVLPAGHRNLFLIGHSMGGAISARFLEGGGPEVQALRAAVLSSPMLKIKGVAGRPADIVSCGVAQRLARSKPADYIVSGSDYEETAFEKNELTHSAIRYQRLLEQVRAEPLIKLGSPTHGWFDQACQAAFRARTGGASVRTPVRVLVAGADTIVHNDGAREFCSGVPRGCAGPAGGPITIDGARHELMIESDAMRSSALTAVLSFFESRRQQ